MNINSIMINIYRRYFETYLPYSAMIGMYKIGLFPFLKKHNKNLFNYYNKLEESNGLDEEQKSIIKYIRKAPFQLIPYDFVCEYRNRPVKVYKDFSAGGMCYIVDNDKKLYFKRSMSKGEIVNRFNALSSEQDILSPHRYLTHGIHMIGTINRNITLDNEFMIKKGDIVADLGAAEGNFSISVIDLIDKIYLFEYDTEWLLALEQTFKPYSQKVVIVDKMIGDLNTPNSVTVDEYFKEKPLSFIKADLEGYEENFIAGAVKTLKTKDNLRVAVSTYHKTEHAKRFEELFKGLSYSTSFSNGYLHPWSIVNNAPYLTKGVLRAVKE